MFTFEYHLQCELPSQSTVTIEVCYTAPEAKEKKREFIREARKAHIHYRKLTITKVAA